MATRKLKITYVAHVIFLLDSSDLYRSSKLLELDMYLFWIGVGGATALYKQTLTPMSIGGQNGREGWT